MSPKELGGTRAFKTDYEIYDQRAARIRENAQIDVYIGLPLNRISRIRPPLTSLQELTGKTERKGRKG